MQHRPGSAFGHFLEGCLFGRAGNNAGSDKNLHEALRLGPNMWQAHLHLVNLYLLQSRRNDAMGQFEVFLKAFPGIAAAPGARELLRKLKSLDGVEKQ